MKHMKGCEITKRSFEIIRNGFGPLDADAETLECMVRIAHTTGDIPFAKTFLFTDGAAARGIAALREGANVITDVEMVRTGIRKTLLHGLGGEALCYLNDPEVMEKSKTAESTRSALGMREAADAMENGIVAIGNAPTALFELMEMIREGAAKPALVIGVPVGFVGAYESKEALSRTGIPHITNLHTRGGSTIAAALVNGLLDLASGRDPARG